MKRYSRWISCFPVGGFDSQSIVEKKEDAPGHTNKNRPVRGGFWIGVEIQYLNSGMAFNSSLVALYTA